MCTNVFICEYVCSHGRWVWWCSDYEFPGLPHSTGWMSLPVSDADELSVNASSSSSSSSQRPQHRRLVEAKQILESMQRHHLSLSSSSSSASSSSSSSSSNSSAAAREGANGGGGGGSGGGGGGGSGGTRPDVKLDQEKLKQLHQSMGFNKDASTRALLIHR